jgi:hypothetical protein
MNILVSVLWTATFCALAAATLISAPETVTGAPKGTSPARRLCPRVSRLIARGFFLSALEGDMDLKMTALERAFQLASSGKIGGIDEIRKALRGEGYSADPIQGAALKRQLTDLVKTARERDLFWPP